MDSASNRDLYRRVVVFTAGIAPANKETLLTKLKEGAIPKLFKNAQFKLLDNDLKTLDIVTTNTPDRAPNMNHGFGEGGIEAANGGSDFKITPYQGNGEFRDVAAGDFNGMGRDYLNQHLKALQDEGLIPADATWKISETLSAGKER